jgi:hypothetical protein
MPLQNLLFISLLICQLCIAKTLTQHYYNISTNSSADNVFINSSDCKRFQFINTLFENAIFYVKSLLINTDLANEFHLNEGNHDNNLIVVNVLERKQLLPPNTKLQTNSEEIESSRIIPMNYIA